MARKVMRNGLFNAAGWLVAVTLSIVSTPYFVSKLTAEGYGLYVLMTGIVGYYNLLDLGLGQAVIKFVAQHWTKDETDEVNASINATLTVQLTLGIVGSSVVLVMSDTLITLLNVPLTLHGEALAGLYLCAGGFLITMVTSTFASVLNGLQRYDITAKTNIISNTALITVSAGALFVGYGLRELVAVTVAFALVTGGVYFVVLKRLLPTWTPSLSFARAILTRLVSFSGFVFVAQLSNFVSSYLVRVMISMILGPAAVTLYVIPSKLTSAFGGLLSSGFSVLLPAASALHASEEKEMIQRGFVEGSRLFASISVPVLLLLFVFASPVLDVWMGREFADKATTVLRIISLASLIGSLTTVPNMMTLGLGHSRIIAYFSIATLISYLISLPLLTWLFGVNGTAWAMLLSSFPGVVLILFEAKRIFKVEPHKYARSVLGFHVIPFVLAIIVVLSAILPIGEAGIFMNLAICSICYAAYFVLMISTKWLPIQKYVRLQ
ncbi:MAG: flippase [Bacteroidetes bacterium]|nr:flippase [Bacteroidota bacterium]MCW5896241.1 flippase [Bacteroidota bacterium]